jgi:hypothetical protein
MSLVTSKIIEEFKKHGITWENSKDKMAIIDHTAIDGPALIERFTEPEYLWVFTNRADLGMYNSNPELYFPKETDE